MNIEKELLSVMSMIFGKEITNTDITMDSEDLWDSLKHIELIMTIEEEFEVSFNPDDIPNLRTFEAIASKIKELKNN